MIFTNIAKLIYKASGPITKLSCQRKNRGPFPSASETLKNNKHDH